MGKHSFGVSFGFAFALAACGSSTLTSKVVDTPQGSTTAYGAPRNPSYSFEAEPELDQLRLHLAYVEKLLQTRDWLAGKRLSLADFAAAAHISVLDYFGDIPWRDFPAVKDWYMKVKSRPAFRPILADRWPGLAPAGHYDDLDF